MAKRKSATASTSTRTPQPGSTTGARPKRKRWTFLFYMCGDNDILDGCIADDLAEIFRVGSSADVHVVVQCDRRAGARRYVLPEGPTVDPPFEPTFDQLRVNTGDPREAIDFLRWGIEQAPSEHVAVFFSGLGINPGYVAEILTPQETRRGLKGSTETRIQQRLFSICHDQTSCDALEAHDLSEILADITGPEGLDRPIDLIGFDLGAAAFVEIAYEMQGLVEMMVASQRPLPDNGWPYDKLLLRWQDALHAGQDTPAELATTIVDTVADEYLDPTDDVRIVALNLAALEGVARALDTMSLAIMQNLGDWHVLNAIQTAGAKTNWVSSQMPDNSLQPENTPARADFLPAVDLLEILENAYLAMSKEAPLTPEEYGQRFRIEHLRDLIATALPLLKATHRDESPLVLHARPRAHHGLSILMTPPRSPRQIKEETGHHFSLSNSNYMELRFSQRVHWAAMMGVFKLITEKPHTLWRLISSVLVDASGPARDALLHRLVSKESVIDQLQQQFRSIGTDAALTLSLEPKQSVDAGEGREYLLRLESSLEGATVAEQTSRVYQTSVDAALEGLEALLQDPLGADNVNRQLESLGRTLGEDLIQRLEDRLYRERQTLVNSSGGIPHLRLQIPRELMRYPWELMHDRYGMLCERFAFGRQVFMDAEYARRRSAREPSEIRVLIIGDPQFDPAFVEQFHQRYGLRPAQLPGARDEAVAVHEAFQRLNAELAGMPPVVVKTIIGQRLSCLEMRELFRSGRFDIIHFAGHAHFVQSDPEDSAWMLSDGLLHARDIRNTLAWTESPPWLVFANACEAGMDAGRTVGRYQGDVFGLATAFINQAVAAYIAPLWPVDDEVATELAICFYYALLADRMSLGESLHRAKMLVRDALLGDGDETDGDLVVPRRVLSWASVVLYGDPTRQLVESLWSPYTGKTESAATPPVSRPPVAPDQVQQRMRGFASVVKKETTISDDSHVYPVWYGTNRKPRDPFDIGQGFGSERDRQLHYGKCRVVIPATHKFGSLGSAWWKRWATWTDDRVRLLQVAGLTDQQFWLSVREELALRDEPNRVALVYIHGFNVTFEEAAIRAAQIGFDLKVPGLTAFYSWPSRGHVRSYVADGSAIEASEPYLTEFLTRFANESGAQRIHIIAHSMGNRGLLRSLPRIVAQATAGTSVPFGQIFLAAPDVDADSFNDLAKIYTQVAERTTLYVSSRDLALAGSTILNDHVRAGFAPPVTIVEGIDTVEVSQFDVSMLGHNYYGGAEGVLYDMHQLLMYNSPPHRRPRIHQVKTSDNRIYWRVQG